MKFKNVINSLALALLTLCSITNMHADTNESVPAITTAELAQLQEQLQDDYQTLLIEQINQLKAVDLAIEDLLLAVSNNAITVKNKQEFVANAKELRTTIEAITKEGFVEIDATMLYMLNQFCAQFTDHVITTINNGCSQFAPCVIDVTRCTPCDPTVDELKALLAATGARIQKLNNKSETAGLAWYNKSYRAFDSWVIQPTQRHNLHHWAAGIAATTLLVGLWVHRMTNNTEGETGISAWRDTFGDKHVPAVQLEGNQTKEVVQEHLGKLGQVEKFTHGLIKNVTALEGLVIGYAASPILIPAAKTTYNWLATKMYYYHNQLKGGIYAKKPEQKNVINPRVKFDDLVGLEQAKQELSIPLKYLEKTERFDKNKLTPHKGFLLTGPTRVGKTFLAEAFAGEVQAAYKQKGRDPNEFNFFSLSASEVQQMGIQSLLLRAKQLAPCILFIDEFHLLNLQQVGDAKALSEFLSAMSGCLEEDPDKVVIIIAATNKPEKLDHALRQHGRFGKEIALSYPDYADRKTFLERKINAITDARAFDLEKLAREGDGLSYEDLGAVITNAGQKALISGCRLSQELLEISLDSEVRKIMIEKNVQLHDDERRLLAVHQAGHALAVTLLSKKETLAKVTIRPYMSEAHEESIYTLPAVNDSTAKKVQKVQYGKIFTYHNQDTRNIDGYNDRLESCKLLLAGHIAEQILLGACGYKYRPEVAQQAFDIALALVTEGIAIDKLPDDLKASYFKKALALRDTCKKEVVQLLTTHKGTLETITQALLSKETLTGAEVAELAGLAPQKKPVDAAMVADELGIKEVVMVAA